MAIRKTTQLGEDVLRETAQIVEKHDDSHIKSVITDLIETMRHEDLVGMAAPQIGESLRIFVSEIRETKYRKGLIDELKVCINPIIIEKSEETQLGWEGCGSIPGLFGQVDRVVEITLEYTNREGIRETGTFAGLLAVIIQHELDHLDGIMFTDLADPATFVSGEYYKEHIRGT